jgi:lipoprotein-anchoring transpeptidase ErfK/SrfK
MASVSRVAGRRRIRWACSLSAVLAAAIAATAVGFEAKPALARGYLPWFFNDQPRIEPQRVWSPQPRFRAAHKAYGRHGGKASGAPPASDAKRADGGNVERPLFAVVSIADQRVSIYNHNGLVDRSPISTGIPGHPTPKGVFTIIGRERYHHSNIYSGAPMPFMQRITWSGIAMHLGVVPGHPASHGCIRLPAGFAAKLWGMTKIGERVVISPYDVAPAEFAHPLLPTPKIRVETEANKAEPAAGSPQASDAAVQPPALNPRQYAEQMKTKATAEAAAAAKAVKEASAAVSAKRQEAARAAAELEAAENAQDRAQSKAEAAAEAYETAAAAAESAKQRKSSAAADLAASHDDDAARAKAERFAKAYEAAAAAEYAAATAKARASEAFADARARSDAAKAAASAREAELADALRRLSEATAASQAAAKAEKEALVRLSPLSILVSKKDGRIYVRQGLAPLFDAPATVRDPETPLGSHLFIATAAESDGAALKWSVVSMPARAAEVRSERGGKTASLDERLGSPSKQHKPPSSAAEALERIEIAQDIRDRIAERLWTGGSLIISDQPLSGETGAVGTDLTVKFR